MRVEEEVSRHFRLVEKADRLGPTELAEACFQPDAGRSAEESQGRLQPVNVRPDERLIPQDRSFASPDDRLEMHREAALLQNIVHPGEEPSLLDRRRDSGPVVEAVRLSGQPEFDIRELNQVVLTGGSRPEDPPAVDERAVRTPQVPNEDERIGLDNFGVSLRNIAARKRQIACGIATDPERKPNQRD